MKLDTGNRRRKVTINIASLIDVVFLLLIFFVVTSTFLERPGLDLSLPEANSAEVAAREELTLRIEADGGLVLGDEPVVADELIDVLRRALEERLDKRLVLEADERVPHGRVVEAMDAARQAGATGLVVATRPVEDSPQER
jgi:biopolymer transport protein ExbD